MGKRCKRCPALTRASRGNWGMLAKIGTMWLGLIQPRGRGVRGRGVQGRTASLLLPAAAGQGGTGKPLTRALARDRTTQERGRSNPAPPGRWGAAPAAAASARQERLSHPGGAGRSQGRRAALPAQDSLPTPSSRRTGCSSSVQNVSSLY